MKTDYLWKPSPGTSMSNIIFRMFEGDAVIPSAMNLFHYLTIVEHPILANHVAQFIFRVTEREDLTQNEIDTVHHLTSCLKEADEHRRTKGWCTLSELFNSLPSTFLH